MVGRGEKTRPTGCRREPTRLAPLIAAADVHYHLFHTPPWVRRVFRSRPGRSP